MRSLLAAALLLPALASAQTEPDPEYRETDVDADRAKLTVRGGFETAYYEYGNIDFRVLDETGDQAILDSDDRGAFAFTGAQLELGAQVDDQVRFVLAAGHRGLWGDDQLGGTSPFGGFLYFSALHVDLHTAPDAGVRFRVGRQFYSLGGLGGQRDFVLADVLDMVRVDIPVGEIGTWTLIPLNVLSTASDYSQVNFVGLIGQQTPETFSFRGDVLTRRFGTTFDLAIPDLPLGAQAHLFFTSIHGRGTGSDISFQGALGNFSDNDGVTNLGVRAHGDLGPLTAFGEFNGSLGIDRKEQTANDVDTNGLSFGGGLALDTEEDADVGVHAVARYFESFGPAYGTNGLQYSHGYVGMKGQQVGGMLFNRFLGTHPTAYVGRNGVVDNPHDLSRKAGLRSVQLSGQVDLDVGLTAGAGVWLLQDAGLTFLDFTDLDNVQPPFGHSRSEFAAEERLGRPLGTELNADVGWGFGPHVDVWAQGGLILPGSFYELVIDRVAGSALGSTDPKMPLAAQVGTGVRF